MCQLQADNGNYIYWRKQSEPCLMLPWFLLHYLSLHLHWCFALLLSSSFSASMFFVHSRPKKYFLFMFACALEWIPYLTKDFFLKLERYRCIGMLRRMSGSTWCSCYIKCALLCCVQYYEVLPIIYHNVIFHYDNLNRLHIWICTPGLSVQLYAP